MQRIAIIGAGLAGLTAANILSKNAKVKIFEKSRGVGGRIATRRAEPYFFDHGAQFFKARSVEFKEFLAPMIAENIVTPWRANFAEIDNIKITNSRKWDDDNPHYIAVPGMSAMGKYLAKDLDVTLNTRAGSVVKDGELWRINDEDGNNLGEYDFVISSIPPAQSAAILPQDISFFSDMQNVQMNACFSLMLGFEEHRPLEFDAALVRDADISWISVNNSKPGRAKSFCILVHSSNAWADKHIDDDRQQVMDYLCKQTSKVVGFDVSAARHKDLHGWRYANIKKQNSPSFLIDEKQKIAACGDWLIQGRIESRFIILVD